jgi:hypothetical protein
VLDKLKSLPPIMAESFADSFAKGVDSLLVQQNKKLASRKEFPPMLPEALIEETPLQFRKGKKRAMTGLEIAEEKERDASRQRRRDERAAANAAAADVQLEEHERGRREEQDLVEAAWVADTQLRLSQLSHLDADEDQHYNTSSPDASGNADDNELGSQAQPLEISSSDSDNEPRRSGRAKRSTRAVESQQWQVEHGLIPAPGAKAKARALSKKKKENTKTSQIDHDFRLL